MLKQVAGFEGKDGKGRKIIVAHSFNQWNEATATAFGFFVKITKPGVWLKVFATLQPAKPKKKQLLNLKNALSNQTRSV